MQQLTKNEVTDDELNSLLADQLILKWYSVSRKWKEKLGHQKISPYCKHFRSSRQYEDASDLMYQYINKEDFIKVDLCIDKLTLEEKASIQREMRNRQVKAKVWNYAIACNYEEAVKRLIPMFEVKGLFE